MPEFYKELLFSCKGIEIDLRHIGNIPEEGAYPLTQQVLPFSVVRGTRGYIEKVVNQINGTYENGWFDSCAVMIRRLFETLIIEVYEKHCIAFKIQNATGDYLHLGDLIAIILSETTWNLNRKTKIALPRLKDIGDNSAHSRRFVAHRKDIEKHLDDIRIAIQDLIYLAGLK